MSQKVIREWILRSCLVKLLLIGVVHAATAQTNDSTSTDKDKTPLLEELNQTSESDQKKKKKCLNEPPSNEWIDRMRSGTHRRVCGTVLWLDGLFGDKHEFDDTNFRGKLTLGFREDEIEGFDPKLRVRVKAQLPNVSEKLNAFVGRVEEDSYISNTEVNEGSVSNVGLRSTNDDDDEWLIGLGYRNPKKNSDGFDFSVGAKISSGLKGYAKLAHRHLFEISEKHSIRTTQTVFYQRDDKFGVSSSLDYTYLINQNNIFEWDSSIKHTEAAERTEWVSSGRWHHSITPKSGISSSAYVRGETERAVDIPEFGLTFTYLKPIYRPWFYIETGIDFRWEKEIPQHEYKSATRFTLQFQMLLGDYYGRNKHNK